MHYVLLSPGSPQWRYSESPSAGLRVFALRDTEAQKQRVEAEISLDWPGPGRRIDVFLQHGQELRESHCGERRMHDFFWITMALSANLTQNGRHACADGYPQNGLNYRSIVPSPS